MKSGLLFLILLLGVEKLSAFPQLIRHGYTSCNTCHLSPRGGGVMTDYGRALSKELLSSWSYDGEENWHFGALNNETFPKGLLLGGDIRAVQSHIKTPQMTRGRFIKMQEQVELAYRMERIAMSVSGASDTTEKSRPWYLPQYYLLGQLSQEISVRVGRFLPRFGLAMPDHILSTRGPLGFGYQKERDTVEMFYQKEKWDLSLATTFNKTKDHSDAQGLYGQVSWSLGSRDRWGISFEHRSPQKQNLESYSFFGQWGLTEKIYLLTDTVWQKRQQGGGEEGVYHFAQLGFEMEKGFHLLILEDFQKNKISAPNLSQNQYGVGVAFYPRPHWEFQAFWTRKRELNRGRGENGVAWLLMHFYL